MKRLLLILIALPTLSFGQANIAYTVTVTDLMAKADDCDGGLNPLCPNKPQDPVFHIWSLDAEANENTNCWIYDNDDAAKYNLWIDIQNLELANETGVMTSFIQIDMGGFESDELVGSIQCNDWNGDAVMSRQLAQQFDLSLIPQSTPYQATIDIGGVYFAKIEIEWVDLNASLNELSTETQFSMAPNPSKGLVKLALTDDVTEFDVQVMDMTGRVVQEHHVQSNKTSLTINEGPGVYLVRVTNGTKVGVQRLVIN
jgi:hypothetical protein